MDGEDEPREASGLTTRLVLTVAELIRTSGTQFDPGVIEVLVDLLGERTTAVDQPGQTVPG